MLQIKTNDQEPWQGCTVDYIAFGPNTYIRFSTKTQHITLFGSLDEIKALLKLLGHKAFHGPVAEWVRSRNVLDMTPQDVIDYFRNSPVLAYLADEIEAVLMTTDEAKASQFDGDIETVTSVLDLSELFDGKGLAWGAQAKIAKALGIPNAGAHRKRILAVVRQLEAKFTTTTEKAA